MNSNSPDNLSYLLTGFVSRLQVKVGNKQVIVGYLRYEKSFWDNDPFRYGVFGGIGGALLVIILIILCCCCCCRRSTKPDKSRSGLEAGILTNSSKGSNDYGDKGYTSTYKDKYKYTYIYKYIYKIYNI